MKEYSGYLAPHTKVIKALHASGMQPTEIGVALAKLGLRCPHVNYSDDWYIHCLPLAGMVSYVLRRLNGQGD